MTTSLISPNQTKHDFKVSLQVDFFHFLIALCDGFLMVVCSVCVFIRWSDCLIAFLLLSKILMLSSCQRVCYTIKKKDITDNRNSRKTLGNRLYRWFSDEMTVAKKLIGKNYRRFFRRLLPTVSFTDGFSDGLPTIFRLFSNGFHT